MKKYFVFDVESAGLYGDGFAFGYVVVDENGKELDARFATSGLDSVKKNLSESDREWLEKHTPDEILYPEGDLKLSLDELHTAFINSLKKHKGAIFVSDCGYPVEAKWLLECKCEVYPLHDVATALLLCGKNPTGTYGRNEREQPAHHPLADARQSARIWLECINKK